MPEIVQKKLYDSVKVFWLNRELLFKRLEEIAKKLSGDFNQIRKIILFGSQAKGTSTPFSDVDILLIIDKTDIPFLDRASSFQEYFFELGLDVDIFVYTEKEFEKSSLKNIANQAYRVLFER